MFLQFDKIKLQGVIFVANTKKEKDLVDISKVKEELTDYVNIQIQKGFTAELE